MNLRNTLITGGEHEDRLKYATLLVLKLFCENLTKIGACETCSNCTRVFHRTHPNLIFVEPTATKDDAKPGSGAIKIDQVREIILASNKTNFESGMSVFLISHMHQATKSAANALLKVIEESSSHQIFIALAPSRTSVIATIASRLVVHQVKPRLENHEPKSEMKQKIFSISQASLAARFSYCEQFSVDKEKLSAEMNELVEACHLMLRNQEASPLLILKVREALEKAVFGLKINLNPRLVVERLILQEWPTIRT